MGMSPQNNTGGKTKDKIACDEHDTAVAFDYKPSMDRNSQMLR